MFLLRPDVHICALCGALILKYLVYGDIPMPLTHALFWLFPPVDGASCRQAHLGVVWQQQLNQIRKGEPVYPGGLRLRLYKATQVWEREFNRGVVGGAGDIVLDAEQRNVTNEGRLLHHYHIPFVLRQEVSEAATQWSLEAIVAVLGVNDTRRWTSLRYEGSQVRYNRNKMRWAEPREVLALLDGNGTSRGGMYAWQRYELATVPSLASLFSSTALPNTSDTTAVLRVGGSYVEYAPHFDQHANTLVHLRGRKELLLYPPGEAFNMYPFDDPQHPEYRRSAIWPRSADMSQHPRYADAMALRVTLNPGDLVYIPAFWWHYVENYPDASGIWASCNRWVHRWAHEEDGAALYPCASRMAPPLTL